MRAPNVMIALSILICILPFANGRRRKPNVFDDVKSPRIRRTRATMIKRIAISAEELPSRESHLVKNLPLLRTKFPNKQYAGHIPASSMDRNIFYWLIEPEVKDASTPLLIWLNGGPGCSSLIGLFVENGPFRLRKVNNDWSVGLNPHSWHKLAYVLYIDQPVGTGFSFTTDEKYCKDDQEVNEDFHAFFQNFLTVHAEEFVDPESKSTNRKVFFSGESYAGHYIPSIMSDILRKNDAASPGSTDIKIVLGGAAIGNGWVDPFYQYSASLVAYSNGFIDLSQWAHLNAAEKECQDDLFKGNMKNRCFTLLDEVIAATSSGSLGNRMISIYDARVWGESDSRYPPGISDIEAYLGNPSSTSSINADTSKLVLEALHATDAESKAGQKFEECSDPPYFALHHQDGQGVTNEIVHILNHKSNIPLLFFNGMEDLVCNHAGNELFLDKLSWAHAEEWSISKRYAWKVSSSSTATDESPAGYVKSHRNLSLLKIKNAGHMVPMDQPQVAFEMMKTFLLNDSFEGFSKSDNEQMIPQTKPINVVMCEDPNILKQKYAFDKKRGVQSKRRNFRFGK